MMHRHWRFFLLVVTTVMALVLPRSSEAYVATKTLAQMPVTGRLVTSTPLTKNLSIRPSNVVATWVQPFRASFAGASRRWLAPVVTKTLPVGVWPALQAAQRA